MGWRVTFKKCVENARHKKKNLQAFHFCAKINLSFQLQSHELSEAFLYFKGK